MSIGMFEGTWRNCTVPWSMSVCACSTSAEARSCPRWKDVMVRPGTANASATCAAASDSLSPLVGLLRSFSQPQALMAAATAAGSCVWVDFSSCTAVKPSETGSS